jgi:D-alanyl-D-alanine carboxypeptidase
VTSVTEGTDVDRLEDPARRRLPVFGRGRLHGRSVRLAWLSLAAVATACTATATPAVTTSESSAAASEQQLLLERELERLIGTGEHAPGAVGALVTRDGTATAAVGLASLASDRAMSPDEPMPMASITKTFTAVVVLQLVAEGRLALDDPVEAWLPGLLPEDERITIEQLLAHRSGVVDEEDRPLDELVVELLTEPCTAWTEAEYFEQAVAIPTSPPGANFRYSNVGYVALGALIEAVTDRSYEEELQRRVFEPLGLSTAGFLVPGEATDDGVRGYLMPSLVPEEDAPVDVTCAHFVGGPALAAGGLVASVSDVATFYHALLDGRLLEPDQLKLMQRLHSPGYGLGLQRDHTACGEARGHDGSLWGFAARALASPDGGLTIVLAMNGEGRRARIPPHDEASRRLYCTLLS